MTCHAIEGILTFVKSMVSTTIVRNQGKLFESSFKIISAITSKGSHFFFSLGCYDYSGAPRAREARASAEPHSLVNPSQKIW